MCSTQHWPCIQVMPGNLVYFESGRSMHTLAVIHLKLPTTRTVGSAQKAICKTYSQMSSSFPAWDISVPGLPQSPAQRHSGCP